MILPLWSVAALVLSGPEATSARASGSERLVALVGAVRGADYRGERDELRRLAAALDSVEDPSLVAYQRYWQGFAQWRRALNGFNETPWPADLKDDLEAAVSSFRAALAAKPDWIEAKVGIVGCSASLLYLAEDQPGRDKLRAEYVPLFKEMAAQGDENPRALWLVGGAQLGAPPPYGGDAPKAAATMRRGLEAARREAASRAAMPAYVPAWGGPENLMNLAYLYSHSALQDRATALAYAEGALVAVPDWHYVRDVLMEQIRGMAEPGR
jgi:hypothetical protein